MKVIVVYGPGSRDLGTVGEAPHRTGQTFRFKDVFTLSKQMNGEIRRLTVPACRSMVSTV